jgi:phage-related protein
MRTSRMIRLLAAAGHQIRMPYSKKVAPHIFELRVKGADQVRIFFTYHQDKAYLLHGFIKKSQRIPLQELRIAEDQLSRLPKYN